MAHHRIRWGACVPICMEEGVDRGDDSFPLPRICPSQSHEDGGCQMWILPGDSLISSSLDPSALWAMARISPQTDTASFLPASWAVSNRKTHYCQLLLLRTVHLPPCQRLPVGGLHMSGIPVKHASPSLHPPPFIDCRCVPVGRRQCQAER